MEKETNKRIWIIIITLTLITNLFSLIYNLNELTNAIPLIVGLYFVFLYGYRNRYNITNMIIVFGFLTLTLFSVSITIFRPWNNGISQDMYDKGYTNLFQWSEYKSESNSLININEKYSTIERIQRIDGDKYIVLINGNTFIAYDFKDNKTLDVLDSNEIVKELKLDSNSHFTIEKDTVVASKTYKVTWDKNLKLQIEQKTKT